MALDQLVLRPTADGWTYARAGVATGHIALQPQWQLRSGPELWVVESYARGWRWAATRSGSTVPEAWLDAGEVGVRGATLIRRDGEELRLDVRALRRTRWVLRDADGDLLLGLRPMKDDRVHIEITRPVDPLVLLLTCLFVIVQGLQPFLGGGGGDGPIVLP